MSYALSIAVLQRSFLQRGNQRGMARQNADNTPQGHRLHIGYGIRLQYILVRSQDLKTH